MNKRQIRLQKDFIFIKQAQTNMKNEPIGEIGNLLLHCQKMKFIKYYD